MAPEPEPEKPKGLKGFGKRTPKQEKKKTASKKVKTSKPKKVEESAELELIEKSIGKSSFDKPVVVEQFYFGDLLSFQ